MVEMRRQGKGRTGGPGLDRAVGGHEKSNLDGGVSESWEVGAGGEGGYNNLIPQSVLVAS